MSYTEKIRIQVGEIPDAVRGSPQVEAAEEEYKVSYGIGVCNYLRQAFPEHFQQMFGSYENCVNIMGTAADAYFDKWKVNYPLGLASKAIATARASRL